MQQAKDERFRVIVQPSAPLRSRLASVPNLLSLSRALMAPVLLLLAWLGHAEIFLYVLLLSYFTDILDGYLARILGQVTEFGSKLDSTADRLIYISMPVCAWWLRPDLYELEILSITILLACFVAPLLIAFLRYRTLPSYHTLSSKIAAVVFALTMIVIFSGGPGFPLRIAALVFVFSAAQDIAITLTLPRPVPNVRSIMHARRIVQAQRNSPGSPA